MALAFLSNSCSKSETVLPEDTLNGTWSGILNQPVFGELITNFSLRNVTDNSGNGQGTFKSGDLSICDDTQFNCGPLSCTFDLSFTTSVNSKFEFDQVLSQTNTTCGDGIFELTVIDNNTLSATWYEESFPDNVAIGQLKKQ